MNGYWATIVKNANRPDADGYLTFSEAKDWYHNGNGQPLRIDVGKLDLSMVYAKNFNGVIGSKQVFNLLLRSNSLNDGLVYGNITLKLISPTQVGVEDGYYDIFNFEMHPWSNPFSWPRNIETLIARPIVGKGIPFKIFFNGTHGIETAPFPPR